MPHFIKAEAAPCRSYLGSVAIKLMPDKFLVKSEKNHGKKEQSLRTDVKVFLIEFQVGSCGGLDLQIGRGTKMED